MKKIFKYFGIVLCSSIVLTSCSEDEGNLLKSFNDYTFAGFTDPSDILSVQENGGSIQVPINLSVAQSTDLQVTITVTDSTAISGTHFSFASTTAVIPAGQTEGSFTLSVVNDDEFNESRMFKIEITATSPEVNFGLGGNQGTFKKTVVIVNDDCPSKYSIWFGAIDVEDVGFGSTQGVGSATPAGTCDILRVNNDLPAIGSATNTIYDIILVPDFEGATTGSATVEATVSRTAAQNHPTLGPLDAVYEASGFYDEASQQIVLEYTVLARDANGNVVGTFYTGTNVITK